MKREEKEKLEDKINTLVTDFTRISLGIVLVIFFVSLGFWLDTYKEIILFVFGPGLEILMYFFWAGAAGSLGVTLLTSSTKEVRKAVLDFLIAIQPIRDFLAMERDYPLPDIYYSKD